MYRARACVAAMTIVSSAPTTTSPMWKTPLLPMFPRQAPTPMI
jgi:hypothetical protein